MLNCAVPLPTMLVKCTMVQSTDANNIDQMHYGSGTDANNISWDHFTYKTETLNLKNGQVHRCPQLMLWGDIQWGIN